MKGKFALSYYYFENLDEWYPQSKHNWDSKEFSKTAMAVSGKSQTKANELLIMNWGKFNKKIDTDESSNVSITDDDDFDFSI